MKINNKLTLGVIGLSGLALLAESCATGNPPSTSQEGHHKLSPRIHGVLPAGTYVWNSNERVLKRGHEQRDEKDREYKNLPVFKFNGESEFTWPLYDGDKLIGYSFLDLNNGRMPTIMYFGRNGYERENLRMLEPKE
ncbi:MAG: hypothetical protein ABIH34_02380 [Nanoarchaeota archaeon]